MQLEVDRITKTFGRTLANDAISLSVASGEVLALLGENGAGKTTLMRIVYGIYAPDSGQILINGKPVILKTPKDAMDRGIAMVHQHFALVPTLTVVQNVLLGYKSGFFVRLSDAAKRVQDLALRYGFRVNPWQRVGDLSVGERQRVEILKVLYRDARLIVLDEPTSLLTPQEANNLFAIMRQWTAEGRSVVFITHKLAEVLAVADRIAVLRRGKVVANMSANGARTEELAQLMVGQGDRQNSRVLDSAPSSGATVLTARGVDVRDDGGNRKVKGLDLDLIAGEIVGLAGVEGGGQREIAEALIGLRRITKGELLAFGTPLRGARHAASLEIRCIPDDRRGRGLVLNMSLWENFFLRPTDRRAVVRWGILKRRAARDLAKAMLSQFSVRGGALDDSVDRLSGGNQQKLVLARELSNNPKILIAAQPTQGLDLAATQYVHSQVNQHKRRGAAILYISTDLDELLEIADRIVVLYEGSIVGSMLRKLATRETIGALMGGVASVQSGFEPRPAGSS